MKVFYISPTGSGSHSGSSAANAGTIYDLPRFIAAAGGGRRGAAARRPGRLQGDQADHHRGRRRRGRADHDPRRDQRRHGDGGDHRRHARDRLEAGPRGRRRAVPPGGRRGPPEVRGPGDQEHRQRRVPHRRRYRRPQHQARRGHQRRPLHRELRVRQRDLGQRQRAHGRGRDDRRLFAERDPSQIQQPQRDAAQRGRRQPEAEWRPHRRRRGARRHGARRPHGSRDHAQQLRPRRRGRLLERRRLRRGARHLQPDLPRHGRHREHRCRLRHQGQQRDDAPRVGQRQQQELPPVGRRVRDGDGQRQHQPVSFRRHRQAVALPGAERRQRHARQFPLHRQLDRQGVRPVERRQRRCGWSAWRCRA